jgi:ankyrin repeat protein
MYLEGGYMSVSTPSSTPEALPANPNLRHLKDQARDLLRLQEAQSLSEAQFKIARRYGYASWPRLKAYIESLGLVGELKAAIDANDLAQVKRLMTRYPDLHRAPLGYNKNGPLTWVAECRVPRVPPSDTRLEMARWMIENGSDVHQGGDGPLMRAALDDMRIPMMELLVRYGADVNAHWKGSYPIVLAPCETLAPQSLQWLLSHGADPNQGGGVLAMLVGTYARQPEGKHACLEVCVQSGLALPDTPALALHRGRIDLLEAHLARDPSLLSHRFTEAEIFPPELGLKAGDGLHLTPVAGGTLLHLAMEYDELEIAAWLVEQGADVNARATVDAEGYGGHTPLFHTVVALGRRDEAKARLLLQAGADPNARATFRKQLRDMDDPEKEQMRVFREVTPSAYAHQFQEPAWVSQPALAAIAAAGGQE